MIRFKATRLLQTTAGPKEMDISFDLEKGRLLTLYGPSGAGKTTILRMLAGLTDITSGYITYGDETWYDHRRAINIPARQRSIGFVFQDFALFPHLTVRQNLEFAVQHKNDIPLVNELISLMDLTALQDTHPSRLSGGQQQRVALARAIARRPGLLLLDEPLSALDDDMRLQLQDYILEAHRRYGLTTILVSHYLPEIIRLSDRVICLDNGRIQKSGTPAEIFLQDSTEGKFNIMGEIIAIAPANDGVAITVFSFGNTVNMIASAETAASLRIGDKVVIATTLSDSIIKKIK